MTPIVFIGEAWGEHEANYETPFVGAAGQELYRMLGAVGFPCQPLSYRHVSPMTMVSRWSNFPYPLLNVFNDRPAKDSNNVELFYAHLKDNIPVERSYGSRRFGTGNYWLRADKAYHLEQLHANLKKLAPNLIIPLGATACWALGLGTAIGKLRGFVHNTPSGKCLPCYHPAAILRNWSLRAITLLDLRKARRESAYPDIRTPLREIWTEPSIEDLWEWWEVHGRHATMLALDIETLRKTQISEFGVASDMHHALHIPFVWETREGQRKVYKQWWPDTATETQAWRFVKEVCESPIPKIGQNLKYDVYWLAKELGIWVRNWTDDTMVACHSWQPELGKSLYDLGAMFLEERSWKNIRRDTAKDKDND